MAAPLMHRVKTLGVLACAIALLVVSIPAGAAQIFENLGTFTAFDLDPSIRSQAMGGASGAVFWGSTMNHWANPALLGPSEGITYEDATSSASLYNAHGWTLGRGGLGVAIGGRPLAGFSGMRGEINFQPSTGGQSSVSFSDEIRSWGVGVSLSGIARTIAEFRHDEPSSLTRYVDLAFGYKRKRLDEQLQDYEENGVGADWGLLARGSLPFSMGPEAVPARLEAAYAYSVQNSNASNLGPMYRPHRHSIAAHFGMDLPTSLRERIPSWLEPGFEPLVSLGGAWDREFISVGDGPIRWDKSHLGVELGLGNVAFLRLGEGGRSVWGYGLAMPIGRFGGYRYDEARASVSDGLPASHGWSVWMNFMEIVRALR